MSENLLPRARRTGIVDQSHGQEIMIYDLEIHKAYNLNETTAVVFQACNGKTTYDELKRRYSFSDDLILLALDQLRACNLLDSDSGIAPLSGVTRREVIRRAGLASLVALPFISSVAAPRAANAASLTAGVCATFNGITCTTATVAADCGGYCNTANVNQCQCIQNCCVECSFSATSAICAGVCLETATDQNNCGGCGIVCQNGRTCTAGVCLPPPV